MTDEPPGGVLSKVRQMVTGGGGSGGGTDADRPGGDWDGDADWMDEDWEEEYDWAGATIRAPEEVPFHETPQVLITNLKPTTEVTVRARMPLPDGIWSSWATFQPDQMGRVDLSRMEPTDGTYEGVDASGLFWSMTREKHLDMTPDDPDEHVTSVVVELSVEMYGKTVGETTIERTFADDVETKTVDEGDLVGEFHRPEADGPHPGILFLGGSGGGVPGPQFPMLLASQGYAVLSLAYFGTGDLPETLEMIPLEYFDEAIEWLAEESAVADPPYGVVGISRGGELALELGSRVPELETVVGYVPSGVRFDGIPNFGPPDPAWTVDGEPLSTVSTKFSLSFVRTLLWRWLTRNPIRISPTYADGLAAADEEIVEAAEIPVEEIGGPVLLVSGDDDGLWPADDLAEIAVDRLDDHDYDAFYDHEHYEEAGHGIGLPNAPTTETVGGTFLPGLPMEFGGTASANAEAAAEAWTATLETLEEGLD